MAVKTERITILGTPEFKKFLGEEAGKEGVSVSELVRNRCRAVPPTDDEIALQELIKQARQATRKAGKALEQGLRDAEAVIEELRAAR